MKHTLHSENVKLAATAVLSLVCAAASAQSGVTIYGAIDIGLLTQSNAPVGTASTQLATGGITPSHWGFRGTEDLGGGLKVNFNLESHFASDTGAALGPGIFRRQANVGLSSANMGSLTLGTQYSPAVLAFGLTDPRGIKENFSGLFPWVYNSGILAGTNTNNDVGVFMENAISYSNTLGPVGLSIGYSLAEKNLAQTGAQLALGATYSGPVVLSVAYQLTDRANTSDTLSTMASVGAGYTMGALTAKLNYFVATNKDALQKDISKVEVLGLGMDWKTAPNNTVSAIVYYGKDKLNASDKTTSLILTDEYALSKRTTLYATVVMADADKNASLLTTIVAGGTRADRNSTLFNVGVRHTF